MLTPIAEWTSPLLLRAFFGYDRLCLRSSSVFAVRNGVVEGVMNWLGGNPLLHDPPLHLPCLRLPLLVLPNFVVDPYTISLDEPYVQCGGSSFAELYVPVADGTTGCSF
ncbi:hypothetical protein BTUL_0010g00670 [Botrytis tulipae]|uniref:Uncharacterized protein n=2 Tax=Sclerotiniaceae TaxID=28983 RepID=A0A4Z1IHA1_9HELO|nr:hypothetical protein BTUL_0010g00670 [Botrytis tulipae]TGO61019.1 hypothetical protein BOTNAR_0136g00220 [Botryotinia narcissicola]